MFSSMSRREFYKCGCIGSYFYSVVLSDTRPRPFVKGLIEAPAWPLEVPALMCGAGFNWWYRDECEASGLSLYDFRREKIKQRPQPALATAIIFMSLPFAIVSCISDFAYPIDKTISGFGF